MGMLLSTKFMRHSLAAIVLMILSLSTAAAQEWGASGEPSVKSSDGIPIGPFIFSPSLALNWESHENVFFEAGAPTDDEAWHAQVRLAFEMPIRESYLRFAYTGQYREFKRIELREPYSHFFAVTTGLEFANGLVLTANYDFAWASMEVDLIDPGGEITFDDRPFEKHRLRLSADYWFSYTDGISLSGSISDFSYAEEGNGPFYDYRATSLGLGWLHQLSPTSIIDVTYRRSEMDALDTLFYRDSTSDELTLGLRGQLTPVLSSELRAGYRRTQFETSAPEPEVQDFEGYIVSGGLTWDFAHQGALELGLTRWDYPSAYQRNAYYDAMGASLTYTLNRGRLAANVFVQYQENSYEIPDLETGRIREDETWGYGLGLSYYFGRRIALRGAYSYAERRSLAAYSYEASIITIGLLVGY